MHLLFGGILEIRPIKLLLTPQLFSEVPVPSKEGD